MAKLPCPPGLSLNTAVPDGSELLRSFRHLNYFFLFFYFLIRDRAFQFNRSRKIYIYKVSILKVVYGGFAVR